VECRVSEHPAGRVSTPADPNILRREGRVLFAFESLPTWVKRRMSHTLVRYVCIGCGMGVSQGSRRPWVRCSTLPRQEMPKF
jgi:predicted nucleic acid-binding Zn ribbon protein